MPARYFYLFCTLFLLTSACFAQTDSFEIGGLMRNYIIHVPSDVQANPPLVINMHGMGSNAAEQQAYTQFDEIADREKFIVVYPNGVMGQQFEWDIFDNRDSEFISALIDTMKAQYDIDLTRVYATGMSLGGYMSHRLACTITGRIAAIASVTGLNLPMLCSPSSSIPVMQIHGTADNIVPYDSIPGTISFWVSSNGCPESPVTTDPYPTDNPSSTVKKDYYGPCDGGSEVVLLTVNGGGHVWFGSPYSPADISASEEVWAFFSKFSLESTNAGPENHNARTRIKAGRISAVYNALSGITITGISQPATIEIFNAQGMKTVSWDYASSEARRTGKISVPARSLSSGLYVVKVRNAAAVSSAACIVP